MTSPHQLFLESSVAHEKLAVWLVVVIGIVGGVEFLYYFCTFWDWLVIKKEERKTESGRGKKKKENRIMG